MIKRSLATLAAAVLFAALFVGVAFEVLILRRPRPDTDDDSSDL